MADFSRDLVLAYDDAADSCRLDFRCFDTPNSITLYGVAGLGYAAVEEALLESRRLCLELHGLWSFSSPESDIARVNARGAGAEVDPRTAALVEALIGFNAVEPAFDFTIGPVSFMWKHACELPTDQALRDMLAHVGASKVHVEGTRVAKDDPLAQIDVGGAAKGHAADLVRDVLSAAGAASADIDFGGNLFMVGDHPQGRPWRVAARRPEGLDVQVPIFELSDASAVTSGSYERFVEIGGKRYQHIVDARTGRPCESDVVSATVVSRSSLTADLLATTACLLGSEGLDGLAARHPSCSFLLITADGRVLERPAARP